MLKSCLLFTFQKQQNSLIAGLRATNEALLKQELATIGMPVNLQAEITSGGTSNGSVERKETSPESQDALQIDHTKETTPSTSKSRIFQNLFAVNRFNKVWCCL